MKPPRVPGIFSRILAGFMAGYLLILVIMSAVLFSTYRTSSGRWREARKSELETAILRAVDDRAAQVDLPDDVAVFVYDTSGALLFTNRGAGRRRTASESTMTAIERDGRPVAYYSSSSLEFQENSANRAFLDSMTEAALFSVAVSLALATVIAWMLARSVGVPAARVQAALEAMRDGDLESRVRCSGPPELRSIGAAANDLADMLRHEHELRSQWVQDIVHDLRTPVAALLSQFEAMADGVLAPDAPRLLRLRDEAERVRGLVASLEELMRLEAPGLRPDLGEIRPGQFAAALRERFLHALGHRPDRFLTVVNSPSFRGDEALLFRAVSNLVDNAIKYGDSDGTVTLRIEAVNDAIEISVTNRGVSIPEELQGRLFDRLFRADYARGADGSGLGLTIASAVAGLHDGSIRVASDEAQGTTFTISIPAASISTHSSQDMR